MDPLNVNDFLLTNVMGGGAWATGQRAIAVSCILSVTPDPVYPERCVLEVVKAGTIFTGVTIQSPFAEVVAISSQR